MKFPQGERPNVTKGTLYTIEKQTIRYVLHRKGGDR